MIKVKDREQKGKRQLNLSPDAKEAAQEIDRKRKQRQRHSMSPEAKRDAQERDRKGKQRASDASTPEKMAEKARQKNLSNLKQKFRR